jgi:hypothetical protein
MGCPDPRLDRYASRHHHIASARVRASGQNHPLGAAVARSPNLASDGAERDGHPLGEPERAASTRMPSRVRQLPATRSQRLRCDKFRPWPVAPRRCAPSCWQALLPRLWEACAREAAQRRGGASIRSERLPPICGRGGIAPSAHPLHRRGCRDPEPIRSSPAAHASSNSIDQSRTKVVRQRFGHAG